MGSSQTQRIGSRFRFTCLLQLCHSFYKKDTQILAIRFEDRLAWEGDVTEGTITIDKPDLFGGDEEGTGGVSGEMEVWPGDANQTPSAALAYLVGDVVPAFKGAVSIFLKNFYMGNSQFFQHPKITLRCRPNQWYAEKCFIGDYDINPVHLARFVLTSPDIGRGLSESGIDGPAFIAAADQIYDEGLGMSIEWNKQDIDIEKFLGIIEAHIDGHVYEDRRTGLFTVTLVRRIDNVSGLPALDSSNSQPIQKLSTPAVTDLKNTVTCKFWNREIRDDDTITARNRAAISQRGQVDTLNKTYSGFRDPEIVARIAERDLAVATTPLITVQRKCNRAIGAELEVGSAVIVVVNDFGIDNIVMRVTKIDLGDDRSGLIGLTLVQDVFNIEYTAFSRPAVPGYVPIINPPLAPPHRLFIDVPYFTLAQNVGDAQAQELNDMESYVIALASKPTADAMSATIRYSADASGPFEDGYLMDFCPTGELLEVLLREPGESQTVAISGESLNLLSGSTYLLIGEPPNDELVELVSFDQGTLTINRGLFDTLPIRHPAGTRFWALDRFGESDRVRRAKSEAVYYKLLTRTGEGLLSESEAPTDYHVVEPRHALPYPPGNVTINGEYWPESITGDIAITWAHRDRVQQTSTLLFDWFSDDIGPEPGVSYDVVIIDTDTNNTLFELNTSNTSVIYTQEQELLDHGVNAQNIAVSITSTRDELACLKPFVHEVTRIQTET